MKILADENIALVSETFSSYGELRVMPGREIKAADVRQADALLVRSVTQVNQSLLNGSACRFVGTATSGQDHVDTDWLLKAGIGFASARGCNADSVVDYVFAALAAVSLETGLDWKAATFGIIGCGAVGGRLAKRLLALNCDVKIHDPLLQQSHELSAHFTSLEAVLKQQVVSIHTPLTSTGAYPTRHLLNRQSLALLRPDAVLINAARGEVIDETALLALMQKHQDLSLVIDAWNAEPAINTRLLERAIVATPHIAGYSRAGKINGTAMVLDAFCHHFGVELNAGLFSLEKRLLTFDAANYDNELSALNQILLSGYDVREDHQALTGQAGNAGLAAKFDGLRKAYPLRSEFSQCCVAKDSLSPGLAASLKALGFRLAD